MHSNEASVVGCIQESKWRGVLEHVPQKLDKQHIPEPSAGRCHLVPDSSPQPRGQGNPVSRRVAFFCCSEPLFPLRQWKRYEMMCGQPETHKVEGSCNPDHEAGSRESANS